MLRHFSWLSLLAIAWCLEDRASAEESPDAVPWFRRCLVGMEVGPTGAHFGYSDRSDARYAAHFDGREIVRKCREARSEYVVVWARDGDYAYYASQLLPQPPGLGARDPLREAVEEAREHDLPVIAYCVVQQGGHCLADHPEWEMRDAEDRPLGRFCYRSGYLEFMKQVVDEQLAYGIDGFHIDMLDQGFGPPYGCWCAACQREFAARYGRDMPREISWDETWEQMLEFRYSASAEFEQVLVDHIRRSYPGVTVDFNYHGNPPFSWETGQRPVQHAVVGDFVTGETGVWGFSPLTVGLNAEFYRAATPGVPFQVAMQRGVRGYHDQTTRPLADLRWELLTLLAHGAFVTMIDKTAFDGALDPVAYERIGDAFADARALGAHFGHQPVQEVGVWYSARSRDWIGREQSGPWNLSFLGAHKALAYEHIPWGVVLDENVDLATLGKFAVIWLPNVGIVSDEHVALLTQYVERGGALVVTGQSGCYDRYGKLQERSSLESLVGARLVRPLATLDNWVRFDAQWETARPEWPLLTYGPAVVYAPTAAAATGELWEPARSGRQLSGKEGTGIPMSAGQPAGPALLEQRHGRGVVLTFACTPDHATASEHAVVEARRLVRDAVRRLHPDPRVVIEAPAHVQAAVADDPESRTLRVHLLAYQAPPQTLPAERRPYTLPALIENLPLFRATIRLPQAPLAATSARPSTDLRVEGSVLHATISDVHEVIVIRYD